MILNKLKKDENCKAMAPLVTFVSWLWCTFICCCWCCLVAQSRNPMNCSIPSLSVPHHLSELAQVHVHCIGDAVQPSLDAIFSFCPQSVPASWTFPISRLFTKIHQMTKIQELQLQHQSYQWIFMVISLTIDWFDLLAVQWTFRSLLLHHSSKASILWHSTFFTVHLPQPYTTTGKTIAMTI